MKIIAFILTLVYVPFYSVAQDMDDACIDSLSNLFFSLDDEDTVKLNTCLQIAEGHYNVDSTISWSERLIKLAKYHHNASIEARALSFLSWAYYYKDEFMKANNCNFRAIIIADSLKDDALKADNYRMLGDNYCFINDYQQSHVYYSVALELYEKLHDTTMVAACSRAMAQNFVCQRMYQQAEEYYRRALSVDSLAGDVDYLLADHTGLANMFLSQFLYNGSLKDANLIRKAKFEVAMCDSVKSDFLYNIYSALEVKCHVLAQEAFCLGYKGEKLQQLLDTMQYCYKKGYEIVEKLNIPDKKFFDICKANYLTLSGKHKDAKKILDSLLVSNEYGVVMSSFFELLYTALDNYYITIGDYKNAYYYKSKFYELINNQTSIDYAVRATQDIAKSQFDEHARHNAEQELQRNRRFRFFIFAVVIVLIIFVFEVFMTRFRNRILNKKNIQLEKQKSEIDSQNAQIMSSLEYASMIQRALMADDAEFKSIFSDYFLIYRPLNIVAGDFYWVESVGKYKMVVCADSTGHGVPGAFVSVLGINLLNDLASLVLSNNGSPAKILDIMRTRLMFALGQSIDKYERGETVNMDGIDLALAIIDTENNVLKYSGAYRPLWIYDGNCINVLKPDKMPIGVYVGARTNFTEQAFSIKNGDILYMFSDGITDQFGYIDDSHTKSKHFSIKRLFSVVEKIAKLPFSEQHSALESLIDKWPNGYQQLDDIIFLAVKI